MLVIHCTYNLSTHPTLKDLKITWKPNEFWTFCFKVVGTRFQSDHRIQMEPGGRGMFIPRSQSSSPGFSDIEPVVHVLSKHSIFHSILDRPSTTAAISWPHRQSKYINIQPSNPDKDWDIISTWSLISDLEKSQVWFYHYQKSLPVVAKAIMFLK